MAEKLRRTDLEQVRSQQGVARGEDFGGLPESRRGGTRAKKEGRIPATRKEGQWGRAAGGKGGKCIFRVPNFILHFTKFKGIENSDRGQTTLSQKGVMPLTSAEGS